MIVMQEQIAKIIEMVEDLQHLCDTIAAERDSAVNILGIIGIDHSAQYTLTDLHKIRQFIEVSNIQGLPSSFFRSHSHSSGNAEEDE